MKNNNYNSPSDECLYYLDLLENNLEKQINKYNGNPNKIKLVNVLEEYLQILEEIKEIVFLLYSKGFNKGRIKAKEIYNNSLLKEQVIHDNQEDFRECGLNINEFKYDLIKKIKPCKKDSKYEWLYKIFQDYLILLKKIEETALALYSQGFDKGYLFEIASNNQKLNKYKDRELLRRDSIEYSNRVDNIY